MHGSKKNAVAICLMLNLRLTGLLVFFSVFIGVFIVKKLVGTFIL